MSPWLTPDVILTFCLNLPELMDTSLDWYGSLCLSRVSLVGVYISPKSDKQIGKNPSDRLKKRPLQT